MRMFIKRRITALIMSLLLAVSMPVPALAAASQARSVVYTALGDSIATGYRLSDVSGSYVNRFGKYLDAKPVNMGQNGLASAGLLKKLTSDQKVIAQVRKSDIITISMGGNDMLNLLYPLVPKKMSDLPSSMQKLQSSEYQQQFTEGIAKFSENWDKIVARVKELAPHSVLVVTTLINPYQGIVLDIPFFHFDLGSFSDQYVRQINDVIRNQADGSYLVADSYSSFKNYKGGGKLTNASLPQMDFDPHPNAVGHGLIASAHEAIAIRFTHGALSAEGPGMLLISPFSTFVTGSYEAKPLLTCLTQGTTQAGVQWSLVSAGGTGANLAADGTLRVKRPGKVTLRAVYTRAGSNLSAETERTVTVDYALSRSTLLRYGVPVLAGLAAVGAAILLLRLTFRLRRRRWKN